MEILSVYLKYFNIFKDSNKNPKFSFTFLLLGVLDYNRVVLYIILKSFLVNWN